MNIQGICIHGDSACFGGLPYGDGDLHMPIGWGTMPHQRMGSER